MIIEDNINEKPYISGEDQAGLEEPINDYNDEEERRLPLSARLEKEIYIPPPAIIPPTPPQRIFRQIPTENKLSLRALVETLVAIGLSILLAFVAAYVPYVNILGFIFLPIPILMLVFRRGFIIGLAGTVIIGLLAIYIFGLYAGILIVIQYCSIGLVLGYCFRKSKGSLFTLGLVTLIAAGAIVLGIMLSMVINGLPYSELLMQLEVMVTESTAIINDQGLLNIMPEGMTLEEYSVFLADVLIGLFPAVLIITSMLMVTFCYLISSYIIRRQNYDIPVLAPYSLWRLDWRWSWGVILGLCGYLLGEYQQIPWLYDLGINILYIFSPLLFVCGFAFIVWLLKLEGCSPFAKIILILPFIFYLNVAFITTMLIAVFEPLMDIRGKIIQAKELSQKR